MRILIADDHGIVRQGLRVLIEKQADMEVVGEAEDGLMVVELANKLSPEVILMDISMPNLNGVEAARLILLLLRGARLVYCSPMPHSVAPKLLPATFGQLQRSQC